MPDHLKRPSMLFRNQRKVSKGRCTSSLARLNITNFSNDGCQALQSQEIQRSSLVLNGVILSVPCKLTQDGSEIQFQVNCIAHWVMTSHLLPAPLLTARASSASAARIIYVSIGGHKSFCVRGMIYDAQVKTFGNFGRYRPRKLPKSCMKDAERSL